MQGSVERRMRVLFGEAPIRLKEWRDPDGLRVCAVQKARWNETSGRWDWAVVAVGSDWEEMAANAEAGNAPASADTVERSVQTVLAL